MVWRLLLSVTLAAVLAVGAGLAFGGCRSTDVGVKGDIGGVKGEITVNVQGKKEYHLTGSLPPGMCIELSFIDSTGAVIGSSTVGVPGYADIPDGAVGQNLRLVDCRAVVAGNPVGSTSADKGAGDHLPVPTQWHEMSYWPIDPDLVAFNPWSNTLAGVKIRVPAGVDPTEAMLALVGAGPGSVTGPDVEIDFFAQAVPSIAGARLLVADDEPIVSFDLTWNGVANYATLDTGNVTQFGAGNGWSVVQTAIPLSDFALGQYAWNGGTVEVQSASAQVPTSASALFQTLTP